MKRDGKMRHPKSEMFSEYLDDQLTPSQMRALEEHLEACPRCSSLVQDLRDIQARARALPDRLPPRDLWPEIARSLSRGKGTEAEVIRLHPGRHGGNGERKARGFRISYLQAAAAAVLVAIISGVAGAHFGSRDPAIPGGIQTGPPAWVEQVGGADPALNTTAQEVARLEDLLRSREGELDPMTVRLLEKNLDVIDQAIRESLQALEMDPGNPFLENHLAQAVKAKADYLREATAFVAPAS